MYQYDSWSKILKQLVLNELFVQKTYQFSRWYIFDLSALLNSCDSLSTVIFSFAWKSVIYKFKFIYELPAQIFSAVTLSGNTKPIKSYNLAQIENFVFYLDKACTSDYWELIKFAVIGFNREKQIYP